MGGINLVLNKVVGLDKVVGIKWRGQSLISYGPAFAKLTRVGIP